MVEKAELMRLIDQYASKVRLHAAIEAERIAGDQKGHIPLPFENRLKSEVNELRTSLQRAVTSLPIE